jgi:hypothetical protein
VQHSCSMSSTCCDELLATYTYTYIYIYIYIYICVHLYHEFFIIENAHNVVHELLQSSKYRDLVQQYLITFYVIGNN